MKVIHGSRSEDPEVADFKTCPICGAICFADMDTCFGCLHQFSENENTTAPVPSSVDQAEQRGKNSLETHAPSQNRAFPELQTPLMSDSPDNTTLDEKGITSHHICADKEGRAFEISISIRLL